jgi:ketosteroid isomerase-like protein
MGEIMTVTIRAAAIAVAVALAAAFPAEATESEVMQPLQTSEAAAETLASALNADQAFATATAKDGPAVAFAAWFEPDDSQFIAPGQVTKGAAAVAAGFAGSPPGFTIAWVPDGGVGSASGDLAVTTGRYTITVGDQAIEAGRYLTTWRKDAEGAWKVIIDTTVADPPAAKPQ